ERNPSRSVGVHTEDLEDASQKVGIGWGDPSRRSGDAVERIAEPLPIGDGSGDAAGLPSEPKVVQPWIEPVGVAKGHQRDARDECEQHDQPDFWPGLLLSGDVQLVNGRARSSARWHALWLRSCTRVRTHCARLSGTSKT